MYKTGWRTFQKDTNVECKRHRNSLEISVTGDAVSVYPFLARWTTISGVVMQIDEICWNLLMFIGMCSSQRMTLLPSRA